MKETVLQNLFELNKPKELENIILGLQIEAGWSRQKYGKWWTLPQNTIGCSRTGKWAKLRGALNPMKI